MYDEKWPSSLFIINMSGSWAIFITRRCGVQDMSYEKCAIEIISWNPYMWRKWCDREEANERREKGMRQKKYVCRLCGKVEMLWINWHFQSTWTGLVVWHFIIVSESWQHCISNSSKPMCALYVFLSSNFSAVKSNSWSKYDEGYMRTYKWHLIPDRPVSLKHV